MSKICLTKEQPKAIEVSQSITMTSHQVFLCPVGVLPRFQGHYKPGDMIPNPTIPGHDAETRAYLRSVRKTSPKLKRCTQRGDMTSGRCQFFDESDLSAETRGSGKMCSRSSRCQQMVPDCAIPCGRPWENQEMQ